MNVPRQHSASEHSGRVNQKRRTRTAIVTAARELLERGESPTVASAAEEALVSRTTAYRYFPTQESLLLDLSISVGVEEVEALLAEPRDGTAPEVRMLDLVDRFNRNALANEALYRTAQRHALDTWLAAERAGEGHDYPLREGRRRRWIASALEPLRDTIPGADLERLEAALCLVMGGEAVTVLRDICQLEPEEAVAVAHWAANAILSAGLRS